MNGLYRLFQLFQQYVSNIASARAPIYAFLGFLKPVLGTILFLSHWLLSHITIVETMDSSERKFESCRNDHHQSLERILGEPGIEPATSCSPVLQSEQRGSANGCKYFMKFLSVRFFLQQDLVISLELVGVCWKLCMRQIIILLLKEET